MESAGRSGPAVARRPRHLLVLASIMLGLSASAKDIIVIDPGHGGKDDSGTTASENRSDANHAVLIGDPAVKESLITLELSQRIAAVIAERGKSNSPPVDCVLTRTRDDQNPNFTERMATADKAGAGLIVSIHFNSGETKGSNGPVCIYPRAAVNPNLARDEKIARALTETVRKTTQQFEQPGFTTHSVSFDDSDMLTQRVNGKQIRPNGSYLFLQARKNPALRDVPVLYLEVDFLESSLYRQRTHTLFVERKKEVFEAWAQAIAAELIRQVGALKH